MKRLFRSVVFYVVLAVAALLVASTILRRGSDRQHVSLTSLEASIAHRDVLRAQVLDGDDKVRADLRAGTQVEASYLARSGPDLSKQLLDAGASVDVHKHHDNALWSLFVSSFPILLLLGGFVFILNTMQGGGNRVMQFGKAKARTISKDQPKVTFADVAGADEAVAELQEIKEFLEAPAKFQAMGAKIPKGVLLFGPPGTGKTLLARAVAGEAGVPFFSISGSDFVEMFVGVGASRVRDLFEQAKASAPAIIFVDEIDAVGRHRGAGLGGGHDEREQTLNQLLVEMDGFDTRAGVILIAATNRPDILDPALLRPGRFDRQIVVDSPDLEGRRAILNVSIIPRGRALGWTLALPEQDKYLVTRSELRDQLAMLLGGRTAEEMIFHDPTTGAQNDIERASQIARSMVTEYGMSDLIGPQQLGHKNGEVFLGRDLGHQPNYSDEVAARIDAEVRKLIDEAHTEALEILTENRKVLDRLAKNLVEKETLDTPEVMAILGPVAKRPVRTRPAEAPPRNQARRRVARSVPKPRPRPNPNPA